MPMLESLVMCVLGLMDKICNNRGVEHVLHPSQKEVVMSRGLLFPLGLEISPFFSRDGVRTISLVEEFIDEIEISCVVSCSNGPFGLDQNPVRNISEGILWRMSIDKDNVPRADEIPRDCLCIWIDDSVAPHFDDIVLIVLHLLLHRVNPMAGGPIVCPHDRIDTLHKLGDLLGVATLGTSAVGGSYMDRYLGVSVEQLLRLVLFAGCCTHNEEAC